MKFEKLDHLIVFRECTLTLDALPSGALPDRKKFPSRDGNCRDRTFVGRVECAENRLLAGSLIHPGSKAKKNSNPLFLSSACAEAPAAGAVEWPPGGTVGGHTRKRGRATRVRITEKDRKKLLKICKIHRKSSKMPTIVP
jgi:hypothetical protein